MMKGKFVGLFLFTLLLSVIVIGLWLISPNWVHPHTGFVIAYCASLTLVTLRITTGKEGTKDFPNAVLGATAVRLFLSAGGLITYLLLFEEQRLLFIMTFFIIYFLYVGFEIRGLLATLRHKTNQTN